VGLALEFWNTDTFSDKVFGFLDAGVFVYVDRLVPDFRKDQTTQPNVNVPGFR
jgi:hypothetical protein